MKTYSDVAYSAAPVIVNKDRVVDIIEQHDAFIDADEFFREFGHADEYDARDVMRWLGY